MPATKDEAYTRFTTDLVREWFPESADTLVVGERSVAELAAEFGTPFFAYDETILQRRLEEVKQAFGPDFSVYYSMKANPDSRVGEFFVKSCSGIEIASGGELAKAIAWGCEPDRILFAGPGKTDTELQQAIDQNVGEIHVESAGEAARLNQLASHRDEPFTVSLRVNPAADVAAGAMRMGGRPSPFGVDEESVSEVVATIQQLPHLRLNGVHLYVGTQILSAEALLTQYDRAVDIAVSVASQLAYPLESIDFGGGLGVPYFAHESTLDTQAVAEGISALVKRIKSHRLLQSARLIVEPGRYLTADAGVYVARVTDIKTSREQKYVIIDGGFHHHQAAAGNLGQTIKRNYPIAAVGRLADQGPQESVNIVGPLCTPLDTLARNISLPILQVGDLIGVFRSGCYARSASPNGFLSHQSPAEIYLGNSSVKGVRTVESTESVVTNVRLSAAGEQAGSHAHD